MYPDDRQVRLQNPRKKSGAQVSLLVAQNRKTGSTPRPPSEVPFLTPFSGEGSPATIACYPYSNLSTGGPSGFHGNLSLEICELLLFFLAPSPWLKTGSTSCRGPRPPGPRSSAEIERSNSSRGGQDAHGGAGGAADRRGCRLASENPKATTSICKYIDACIYIYIYMFVRSKLQKKNRATHTWVHIYIYIYLHIHIYIHIMYYHIDIWM